VSTDSLPLAKNRPSSGTVREPLVGVAAACAAGIVLDCYGRPTLAMWLVSCGLSAMIWLAVWGRWGANRWSQLALLIWAGVVGGWWHHVYWNVYPANDLSSWAAEESRRVCARGWLEEEPLVLAPLQHDPRRGIPASARSVAVLRVRAIRTESAWQPATGRVRLSVQDELVHVRAGDAVVVTGEMWRPTPPSNPGQFDYPSYLRAQRIRCQIQCNSSRNVQLDGHDPRGGIWLACQRWAGAGQRMLLDRLGRERGGVAVALLLGRYELMEADTTELFMRTGTMHLLAISGQHLAILAAFLWAVLRFLPVSQRAGAAIVALTVLAYTLVTGARPPVLRAAVLVWVFVGALLLARPLRRANSLAFAALVVLVLNPTDLFNSGCQLSFLAVAAMFWLVQPMWQWIRGEPDPLDPLVAELRPAWQRVALWFGRMLAHATLLSTVVWLANVPLLAMRFHLVTPAVVPLTVILVPVVAVGLVAGLALLVLGPVVGWVGTASAGVCSGCLTLMQRIVTWGTDVPYSYWYVADVPAWWVYAYYAGMGVLFATRPTVTRWRWLATIGVALWLGLGLCLPWFRRPPLQLECRVLAVGHGLATVVRTPDGRAYLYDSGQLGRPQVGSRVVAPALWSLGVTRLHGVFVSHPDLDHYNGLEQLAARFTIDRLYCTEAFLRDASEAVRLLLQALAARGTKVVACHADATLSLGERVTGRVLHPPLGFAGTSNETSLVVLIEYEDRRVLLTGDVEKAGLAMLLSRPRCPVDVLVAPHHGSRTANPAALVQWCQPGRVVVSAGRHAMPGPTRQVYATQGIPVLITRDDGAVAIQLRRASVEARVHR
jgi:competence protein ComEC